MQSLKDAGIISAEATFPAGVFYISYSSNSVPNVGFKLTSSQYISTSKCKDNANPLGIIVSTDKCDGTSLFWVPASGRLGTK